MNIRFYNAKILMLADEKKHSFEIFEGEMWVRDDKIAYIGDGEDVSSALGMGESVIWDREIDASGKLICPGFKNAHTHTAMTFLRSFADDLPLDKWLFDSVFPREDQLTEDDVYWLNILGIMEYITSGITTNFDMYFFPPKDAKASIDCGFRTVLTSGFNNFGAPIDAVEENMNIVNGMGDLVKFIVGFHAEYTTSMERMEDVANLAEKYKSPVWMHNSETKKEVDECIERWGKTPTELTESLGMYNYGGGGYHCVWMSDNDYEIFKKRGLTAVTNPCSNAKLASGFCDVKRFLDEGINLAIGTDGPASNNSLDMFKEMYLAATIAKVVNSDAACVPADEILYSATTAGAIAMGLPECDRLAVGKKADLFLLDLMQPNMQPENNYVKNIVYAGSKSNVVLTMVNGQILFEHGIFNVGFDPEEIYYKANKIIKRMK